MPVSAWNDGLMGTSMRIGVQIPRACIAIRHVSEHSYLQQEVVLEQTTHSRVPGTLTVSGLKLRFRVSERPTAEGAFAETSVVEVYRFLPGLSVDQYQRNGVSSFSSQGSKEDLELTLQTRLAMNPQKSACLCLPSDRIKGLHHYAQH